MLSFTVSETAKTVRAGHESWQACVSGWGDVCQSNYGENQPTTANDWEKQQGVYGRVVLQEI